MCNVAKSCTVAYNLTHSVIGVDVETWTHHRYTVYVTDDTITDNTVLPKAFSVLSLVTNHVANPIFQMYVANGMGWGGVKTPKGISRLLYRNITPTATPKFR